MAPRWATPRTPERPSYGPAVARIADLMGRPLMPWQRQVLDVALEVDPETGEWVYDNVTITVPRQAGKTTLLRPVIVHRMGSVPNARVFMAAQSRDKARARWMDLTNDVKASILWQDVRRKIGNMNEELRWIANDSTVVPIAPNGEGMHGETPDLVAVDELWWYTADKAKLLQAAYVPGFTTKSGQAWKFSTAGTPSSWWLNQSVAAGRRAVESGVRSGTAFFEWSLPDVVDGVPVEELTDEALVEACIVHHPSTLVRPASVRAAWVDLADRGEFMRAYGNRATDSGEDRWRAIDGEVWRRQTSPRPIPADAPVALGFDVDPERRESAVVAAYRDEHGRMTSEVLRVDTGTRWVAGYLAGLVERNPILTTAVNNAGPARDVADELDRAGVPLLRVQTWDYSAACTRHADELTAGTWFHRGEAELTDAAARATWRTVNERRMWARPDEPITALVATTLAGWGVDHAPEPETPQPRFWMG